jgi:maleylacetate reductase
MSLFAEEGIRALAQGLPRVAANPDDIEARSNCLYGAWLCGAVLGNVGMALHHKLCHTLGGTYNLPHAETHTVVLPHALAFNAAAAPGAMQRVARAIGAPDAAQGIFDLAQSLGAPTSLKELGMPEQELERCAAIATQNAYSNPRPVDMQSILKLLKDAFEGRRPN